jgi:tungstate transport system permease protein
VPGAASTAMRLILSGDADIYSAIATSLEVSLTATVIAAVIGGPLGALLAVRPFPGRQTLLVVVNAMMGLPPVVVGLVVYLLLSRAGPLGSLGLLFTIEAMVLAQVLLTLPIVVALTHRTAEASWLSYGDALRIDGAGLGRSVFTLLAMRRAALVTVLLAAFGRAIAEVGAIMIVGGNIRGHTRTMTTAIALETSKGDLAVALGLGAMLVALALIVSAAAFLIERALRQP